jgi:hypothetical protein
MSQATKSGVQLIAAGNGTTVYSDVVKSSLDGMTIVGQIRKTAGAGSAVVTLQGGWSEDVDDTDLWRDLDFAATSSGNLIVPFDTAGSALEILDAYPWYRIKAVCTGAATIEARILFLSH